MHKVLLLDGDGFVYRAGFAAEKVWYDVYDKGLGDEAPPVASFQYKKDCDAWINKEVDRFTIERRKDIRPVEHALSNAKTIMNSILDEFYGATYVGYLSGKTNFRNEIATIKGYKANRKDMEKPVHYEAIREYLIKHWDFFVVEGEEADDAVAIAQCNDFFNYPLIEQESAQTVLVSNDKDLNMIPGWHYDWVKKEKYFIDELTGIRNFYKQLLKGDSTDNIPGLYYVTGDKCKGEYLKEIDKMKDELDMYMYVKTIYLNALKPDLDDRFSVGAAVDRVLNETGQLLWMRRKENETWISPIAVIAATASSSV